MPSSARRASGRMGSPPATLAARARKGCVPQRAGRKVAPVLASGREGGQGTMDFTESPRVQTARGIVREFMRKEVLPLEPALAREGFAALAPRLARVRERARGTGLWAAFVPERYGGAGLPLTEYAHVSEELGRSRLGHYLFNCQAPDVGNMEILMKYGTDEQKERYLIPLVHGEIRSCFSMTEPAYPGSNPVWMGATAVKDGGDYVVNGEKWFSTGADG